MCFCKSALQRANIQQGTYRAPELRDSGAIGAFGRLMAADGRTGAVSDGRALSDYGSRWPDRTQPSADRLDGWLDSVTCVSTSDRDSR